MHLAQELTVSIKNADIVDFNIYASQQFATVLFDREQDSSDVLITVIKDGKVKQFQGNDNYNPSLRRWSSCVYVAEEEVFQQAETIDASGFVDWTAGKVMKVCTIQHKGETMIELHKVPKEEIDYLFGTNPSLMGVPSKDCKP